MDNPTASAGAHTSALPKPDGSAFRLMDLPPEIRDRIFIETWKLYQGPIIFNFIGLRCEIHIVHPSLRPPHPDCWFGGDPPPWVVDSKEPFPEGMGDEASWLMASKQLLSEGIETLQRNAHWAIRINQHRPAIEHHVLLRKLTPAGAKSLSFSEFDVSDAFSELEDADSDFSSDILKRLERLRQAIKDSGVTPRWTDGRFLFKIHVDLDENEPDELLEALRPLAQGIVKVLNISGQLKKVEAQIIVFPWHIDDGDEAREIITEILEKMIQDCLESGATEITTAKLHLSNIQGPSISRPPTLEWTMVAEQAHAQGRVSL